MALQQITNTDFQTGSVESYLSNNGGAFGFKNRVINGAMTISQRYGTAASTATYVLDRFANNSNVGGLTYQQNLNTIGGPVGFTNYMGCYVSTTKTLGSGDYELIDHVIEGYNIADLQWGTPNAQPATLSFWVRSSVAGTYGVTVGDLANNNYISTYTIAANTWTKVILNIPGPTSGTFSSTNGSGIGLRWHIQLGGSGAGSLNTWGQSWNATVGASVGNGFMLTGGNAFYLTGVQFEKGTVATAFEYRDISRELMMCQRYYEQSYPYGTTVSNFAGNNNSPNVIAMYMGLTGGSGYTMGWSHYWKVTKRTSPTVRTYSASSPYTQGYMNNAGADVASSISNVGTNSAFIYGSGNNMYFNITMDAEF